MNESKGDSEKEKLKNKKINNENNDKKSNKDINENTNKQSIDEIKQVDIDEIESISTKKADLPAPETPNISGIPSLRNTKNNDELKNEIENNNKLKDSKDEVKEKGKQNKVFQSKLRTNTMPEKEKLKNSSIRKGIKKSYTQKSNAQIRATITKIEKAEESEMDLPNISEYPTLTNFEEDNKGLSDIIPDFKEKILSKEKEEIIKEREISLIRNNIIVKNSKIYHNIWEI